MDRAFLVGINTYPGCPLAGCVNDVTDMANFLVEKCGFKRDGIRLLVDNRATTTAILDRLHWLVSGLKRGDRVLFHYSGHGAQVATRNPKGEVDGLDEVICPVDFDWSDAHLIRDKQFGDIFAKVPPGVDFIWISDSCHSGDLIREMRRTRCYPTPADMAWRLETARDKSITTDGLRTSVRKLNNVALISGCKSNQTSADAVFNGRPNGALTYFLLKELKKPGALKKSLIKVVAGVKASLRNHSYSQVPDLEGPEGLRESSFLVTQLAKVKG